MTKSKKNPETETDYQKEIEKSIKLFDVSRPGSNRPSSTSRPIIVGHKSTIVADPMVSTENETDKPDEESQKLPVAKKPAKVINTTPTTPKKAVTHKKVVNVAVEPEPEPELADTASPQSEEITDNKTTDIQEQVPDKQEEASVSVEVQDVSKTTQEDTKKQSSEPKSDGDDTKSDGAIQALTDQVTDKKRAEKEQQAEDAYYAELQKSIDSKEFFLPITTAEQRRNMRLVIGLLFFITVTASAVVFLGPDREKINSLLNLK